MSQPRRSIGVVLLLILMALGAPERAGAQGKHAAFADAVIVERVRAAIANDATLRAMDISVTVQHQVVYLEGFVNSRANLARVEALVRAVRGVAGVANALRVSGLSAA